MHFDFLINLFFYLINFELNQHMQGFYLDSEFLESMEEISNLAKNLIQSSNRHSLRHRPFY